MDIERLNEIKKLSKYPAYIIAEEIRKLKSNTWVDLLVSQDILNYNSPFWVDVDNKNDVYSAFWAFVEVFQEQLKKNPYIGRAINNLFLIEINADTSELILKRTRDICNYVFDNNDLMVANNYMTFLKKLYEFSKTEYINHLYYYTLYCKHSDNSSTTRLIFGMIIDIVVLLRDVNYSGVVNNIFHSKVYLLASIEYANKLISIMDSAFIYSGYSTWLTKDKLIHEIRITFAKNKVIIINNTVINKQEFDMVEFNPESDGMDSILAAGLSHYIKTNGYNEVSKTDILKLIRNMKYYGFFDRAFKFSLYDGKMEYYQTIGCLLNFILTNRNLDFELLNINPLIKSQYKFLQAYGLYLTYLTNNVSLFNQFIDDIDVLAEIMKNEYLEFYVNRVINNLYNKLDIRRKNLLDDALASLKDHRQINRILNLNSQLFRFEFDKIDDVKVRPEGSISFGTIIDVPVIELDNLNSLSDYDFIVLINDIDINENKYLDRDFGNFKVKNAKGTFEMLSAHLEKRPSILDCNIIFTPRVLYYNFDILKRLYSTDKIYKYCFSSMSSHSSSNELLSRMAWNIYENNEYFEDNPIISREILDLYNHFVTKYTIVYDTLEINPSKTKYKTWNSGKEYVDIETSYINSNVHSIFDPIYKLTKICKTEFTILKNQLGILHDNMNPYWAFVTSKYFELFEFYEELINREVLDANSEEMLVFGVCSSEHPTEEYFAVIKNFITNKKDIDLISKNDESFNRGYALYAVFGYIYNWDKSFIRQYLLKCFSKKASFHNLTDISFRLHKFGNAFLLKEAVDCIYDKITGEKTSVEQLAIDFAHDIISLLRSITKFDSEVKSLVENILNLINKLEAYKRFDLVSYISFGLNEYNRSSDEKVLIKEIIGKLKVDDFDSFENQFLDDTLEKL
jgi:hypothetical protein